MTTPAHGPAHLPPRQLPGRLIAPEPGWTLTADVVVVGSGAAGLSVALQLEQSLRDQGATILVVTKDVLGVASTQWTEGGFAGTLGGGDGDGDGGGEGDGADEHEALTLAAGAGGCDRDAARVLIEEGPAAAQELVELSKRHAAVRPGSADAVPTGTEVQRALVADVRQSPRIEVVEHALVVDLLLDGPPGDGGGIAGLSVHVAGDDRLDGVGVIRCRAVVLASGGLGQVFSQTTNPALATGDGMAVALRAGATLRDLEFVEFHPTVMYLGPESRGQQPLMPEGVRAAGAVLVDDSGDRVMEDHPLGDLAPGDVVSSTISRRLRATGRAHVWLDAQAIEESEWERRFPSILAICRSYGVDPLTDLVPVAPAAHYTPGGVRTDLWGRTDVPGLYAAGEVACSGVHGADRLAPNSVLERLVFARRIAQVIPDELRPWSEPVGYGVDERAAGLVPGSLRRTVQETMGRQVGVHRNAVGLGEAAAVLDKLGGVTAEAADVESWETSNLLTVATLLTDAATMREESRGSHRRHDFPQRDDDHLAGHIDAVMRYGVTTLSFSPSPPTDVDGP